MPLENWGSLARQERFGSLLRQRKSQLSTAFSLGRKTPDLEHQAVIRAQLSSSPVLCRSEDAVSPSGVINDIPDEKHRLESLSTGRAGWEKGENSHSPVTSHNCPVPPRVSTLLDELVELCLISRGRDVYESVGVRVGGFRLCLGSG